jgi:hypothetical protein
MDIKNEKEKNLTTIKNNFKQLQVLCSKVFHTAPQSSEVLMAREVAKYISCIGLNINPAMVDINTDTVINEFFQQTKLLTDFTKIKTLSIYSFCTSNNQTLKACFYVYFIKRIESLKSYDSLFYFDEVAPKKVGFFAKLKAGFKNLAASKYEDAKSKGVDLLAEKGGKALEDFGTWLANETGIGKGEGNAANSGGQIYWVYKYFPNQPYAYRTTPIKENISANYKKEWVKIIENESGLNFDMIQYYFEKLFPKIHAGYFKNQEEMYSEMKKMIAEDQTKALNKITQKTNPVKSLLNIFGL